MKIPEGHKLAYFNKQTGQAVFARDPDYKPKKPFWKKIIPIFKGGMKKTKDGNDITAQVGGKIKFG